MATSPLYNWPEPDNTDLVKNGALAIRTMGNAIDTTMGTMTPKSTYTAKGSIAAATAASTPANLAVGNNGETLVADSSTSTGLRYTQNFAAGKNKIINGDFGIWQRGTSFSVTGTGSALYGAADRWAYFMNGSGGTNTVSQQTFTPGAAPVAGYEGQFFQRWTTTTVGSGQSVADIRQAIEDVRTFAGQTVTLSYWAKSSSSVTISPIATQNFGSGGSAGVDTNFATAALTSSWVRYTASITVPSISGKTVGTSSFLSLNLRCTGFSNGTTIDLWGVQVEAGSTATAFQTATGSIQGELAACQRYYTRFTGAGSAGAVLGINGFAGSTTLAIFNLMFPVQMRVAPSTLDSNNLAFYNFRTAATLSGGTFVRWQSYPSTVQLRYTHGSAVFAINDQIDIVGAAAAGTYIGLSAEL